MPVQPSRVSMYAVGVAGDGPSDAIRHRLVDGVHLRWAFQKSLGFPRHGFHLFRRRSQLPAERQCLRPGIDGLPAGPVGRAFLDTPLGRIASDADLLLSDEFGWAWSRVVWRIGPVGFDLTGRDRLRLELPATVTARTDGTAPLGVELQIGLRPNLGVVGERIEFWRRPPGSGPNPLTEKGAAFRVLDESGAPRDRTEIEVDARTPPLSGLAGYAAGGGPNVLEVTLPLPATIVFLRISGMQGSIEGFAADGRSAGTQTWSFQEGAFLSAVTFMPSEPVRRVVLRGGARLHTFTFETPERTAAGIRVRALQDDVEVARGLVQGLERQVVRHSLVAEAAFNVVEIDSGPGVLLDLCLLAPGRVGLAQGWEKLAGFPYPLGLPVTHADYPATGGRPVDLAAARTLAQGRVRYGPPDPWVGAGFDDLHDQLVALVEGGPLPPMADRSTLVPGTPRSSRPGPDQSLALRRYPLDSVLLASLHPPIAQMVGLYWVDETAQRGVAYDYLLLAEWRPDPSPEFAARDPDAVLAKLRRDGVADMDACIVLERRLQPPQAPSTPAGVQSFALPGGTIEQPDGTLKRAENVTGLRWRLDRSPSGRPNLLAPVLHHLWRADLGADPGAAPPTPDRYACLTLGRPLLVAEDAAGALRENSTWPPFRLYALDSGLADGWYGYQVSGLDLFGRHGARSAAAEWWQWAPAPDPRPWYYQDPPADRRVHAFAVQQADRIAPPPPAAVEASALDPADPLLLRDAAYEEWRAALAPGERDTVVGLRVRWEWPEALQGQAPDAREFRIYLHPGRLNALAGRVRGVEPVTAHESWAAVDAPSAPAGAVGMVLQVDGRDHQVLGVDAGPPWRVRVGGAPRADAPCALVAPPGHALYADFRFPRAWSERYHVVGVDEHDAVATGPDGRPVRIYEVLLPAAGDAYRGGVGHALAPSRADPVAYAAVGVSAADDRADVPDDPRWASGRWGGRTGNEGAVATAPAIFRVLREPPAAPPPAPVDSERVWATAADYHGRSFYTYRWLPLPNLRLHVFRALDEAVFEADWAGPTAWGPLDPAKPADRALFPSEPRWHGPKLQQVATELNDLRALKVGNAPRADAFAAYRALSNDALRVLAGLPGTERAFAQLTIQPLDPAAAENADRRGPDSPDAYTPNPGLRAHVDELDGRSRNRYFYRGAYVDGAHNRSALGLATPPIWLPDLRPPLAPRLMRILGGDRRVAVEWAAQTDPGLDRVIVYRAERPEDGVDVRLMGPPAAVVPAVELVVSSGEVKLAATDVVMVERVYASAGFDPSQDLLTGQTATQYLAAPTPPTDSRVTGLTAPDGTAVVVVYRDSRQGLQRTPWSNRPRTWVDEGLAGPRTYHYRLVATRRGETPAGLSSIRSEPSELGAGRAVDQAPPAPPTISTIEWVRVAPDGTVHPYDEPIPPGHVRVPAVQLAWTSPDPHLACLVQHTQRPGGAFVNASGWLPRGVYRFADPNELTFLPQTYRLKVTNAAGNVNVSYAPASLPEAP